VCHREGVTQPAASALVRTAAVSAAVAAAAVMGFYVSIVGQQGDDPPLWVLAVFAVGIGAALLTSVRPTPPAALVALVALGVLTVLSGASIGLLLVPSVGLLGLAYVRLATA
jgi:hypothetical protein